MVRVKVRKEDVRDLMAVHTGLDQIHQRARTEIQQERLIRLHQIAGGSAGGMNISAGAEDRQFHSSAKSSRDKDDSERQSSPQPSC